MTGHDTSDTTAPHTARVYDWLLGGKDNGPADEEMAKQIMTLDPRAPEIARSSWAFMHRAIRWLASTGGLRQFLDIGSGLPTQPNLHQTAQAVAPDARVVYTDNDPTVLPMVEALLHGTSEGATEYLHADVREPEAVIEASGKTLDLSRPVVVSLVGMLHFVPDEEGPHELVRRLLDPLPSGSWLVLSHVTGDYDRNSALQARGFFRQRGRALATRSREEVGAFFKGRDLAEPGVSLVADWRPELGETVPVPGPGPAPAYAGVARKL